jgi:signal transduction histidine kinase
LMALIVWTHSRMFSRVLKQVANQRAKVAEAEAQLEQLRKMEALGRFAGSIAHDFNNILSVMQGCITLVDQGLPKESELRGDVNEMQDSISRAGSLTSQLLAFSRRDKVNPVRVDTAPLLRRLSEFAQRLVGEKVKVELQVGEDVWPLWAGPSQIDQLIMNLAANGRDAMLDGGTLTISAKNAPHSPVGDAVLLTVSDTGVGMEQETLARAFEPFFTTKPMGTGLGLATVFGVVKALGGELSAQSEVSKGTVISMWLPRASGEAVAPRATSERSQLSA